MKLQRILVIAGENIELYRTDATRTIFVVHVDAHRAKNT
jgi:hypothetical protein